MSGDLHPAPSIHYACTGCGRSCRDFDEVPIDVETAYRIRSLPLFNPRLSAVGQHLPHRPSHMHPSQLLPGSFTLAKTSHRDGGECCVFLDDDRRCALHLAHGAEAKPPTCRVFPFLFTRTPDGIDAGVSFACTAVLQDHGPTLVSQREELREAYTLAVDVADLGSEVLLAPDQPMSWSCYRELEAELAQLVSGADDIALGLGGCVRRLGQPLGRPAARLRDAALSWMCALQPAFAAGLPGPNVGEVARELPGIARHRAVVLEPMAGEVAPLLRRYLRHRFERRDLLRWPDVRLALAVMLIEMALVDLYAVAIAAPGPVAIGHVAEAIRAVEQRFVVHSGFREQFRADGQALVTLRRIVASPRFGASFLGGLSW